MSDAASPVPTPAPLQAGQLVDGYHVISSRTIGHTELEVMARTTAGKLVALQMLDWPRLWLHYESRYLRQFGDANRTEVEARTRARVTARDQEYRAYKEAALGFQHDGIATVRRIGSLPTPGHPPLTQTLVECDHVGGASLLQEAEGMAWRQRLYFVPPILDALQAIHDQQRLHGNLKLRRIRARWIDDRLTVKLIDAGYFQPMGQWKLGLLGSPEYLAPEIIDRRYGPIDARADLYSLGQLLYTLFTDGQHACGARAAVSRNITQLEEFIAKEPTPPPPSTYQRDLPPALDQLILGLIVKKPEQRAFRSAHDVLVTIRKEWPEACTQLETHEWTVSIDREV